MDPAFLLTSQIVVLAPGTGVLYTLAIGLSQGARASVIAAAGCTLGILPAMLAAILGLAALLKTSAMAFEVFKILGALYPSCKSARAAGLPGWRKGSRAGLCAEPRGAAGGAEGDEPVERGTGPRIARQRRDPPLRGEKGEHRGDRIDEGLGHAGGGRIGVERADFGDEAVGGGVEQVARDVGPCGIGRDDGDEAGIGKPLRIAARGLVQIGPEEAVEKRGEGQRPAGAGGVERGEAEGGKLFRASADDLSEKGLFPAAVVVDQPHGNIGRAGDVADGGAGESLAREKRLGRVENPRAVFQRPLRRGPKTLFRNRVFGHLPGACLF